MKIHQNWLVCRILPLKKKGRHFTTYFSKGNFRRKKKGPILVTVTLTKWTFFSIGPIWMIFMEGRVNTWGNQIEAILDLGSVPPPPIYLGEYWEHPQDFWGGFSTTLERNFFCVRNFCQPPETPLWGQRGVP